jgi:hypothetical protein
MDQIADGRLAGQVESHLLGRRAGGQCHSTVASGMTAIVIGQSVQALDSSRAAAPN